MATDSNLASPRRRRRWSLALAVVVIAVLLCPVAYVTGFPFSWNRHVWKYVVPCRLPLTALCSPCPTLQELDPDGDGRLNSAVASGGWRFDTPLRTCGFGRWRVATRDVGWSPGSEVYEVYFDRSGRIVAAFESSDTNISFGCDKSSAWYGAVIPCHIDYGPAKPITATPGLGGALRANTRAMFAPIWSR